METGGALGIVFIKFYTHEEAKRCVEKENGKKLSVGGSMGLNAGAGEGDEIRVVLDGEGLKLKNMMRELEERRKNLREEKKRKEREAKIKEANAAAGTPPNAPAVQTLQSSGWWPPGTHSAHPHSSNTLSAHLPPRPSHLPQRPTAQLGNGPLGPPSAIANGSTSGGTGIMPGRVRRPPSTLLRARPPNATSMPVMSHMRHPLPQNPATFSRSSSSTPIRSHVLPHHLSRLNPNAQSSPLPPSRSPSPISRRPGQFGQNSKQRERDAINDVLSKNGFDHAKIEGNAFGGITEEDVRKFFEGFNIDKVLQDSLGWYVTFQSKDTARRAAMVLNSGARTLAHHTVTISVHAAPSSSSLAASTASKARWDDDELMDQAEQMIVRELKSLLAKDVMERVVAPNIRTIVAHGKTRKVDSKLKVNGRDGRTEESGDQRAEKRGLKGLSFKKPNKRVREEPKVAVTEVEVHAEEEEEHDEETEAVERPKKRRKQDVPKKVRKVVEDDEVESEDDDTLVTESLEVARKRASSEDHDDDEPVKKRSKSDHVEEIKSLAKKAPPKKKPAKANRPAKIKDIVNEIVLPIDLDYDVPEVTQVHITPDFRPSLSPSSSPVPEVKDIQRLRTPDPDPLEQGLCEDDEDLYFSRLALAGIPDDEPELPAISSLEGDNLPRFRTHITGSARTEGYYKISHAEKSAYVAQYALRATAAEEVAPIEAPQHVTSSRSNRANARRRALGLEEINQVQRAVALSRGETAAEMTIKFNQLQTRKKHLRFARSPIHDWGLYAMERIARGEMVIEYVGEVIRAQVADKREKAYERQGIGSSYLFRIDEDLVVDATKKGNLGYVFCYYSRDRVTYECYRRLINHACDPNCTAKIITISGEKKIVIYAKRDIELGDEVTYGMSTSCLTTHYSNL